MRVGVLASGAGTNLQAILDRVHGRHGVEVVAVGSDQLGAAALQRAARAGVERAEFPLGDDRDQALTVASRRRRAALGSGCASVRPLNLTGRW